MDRLSIELITESDKDEILKFLRKHFLEDEPMNESLGLGECKELDYFCWKNIKDNISFKAVDSHGNCLGVALSGICDRTKGDQGAAQDDLIYRKHEKFYRIIKLTEALDKKVSFFEKHPEIQRFVEGKVLSVDGEHRDRGIAGLLVHHTTEEIKRRRLPLMVVICSSYFSAKVVIHFGFTNEGSIRYKDFFLNGKQAISPKEPHSEIIYFVKWIQYEEDLTKRQIANL